MPPIVNRLGAHYPTAALVHQGAVDSSTCTGTCLRNWKIVFCVLLFVEGVVFGHVVLLVRRFTDKRRAFTLATHFGHALAAGVFLSAGLLHILPEAVALLSGDSHGEEPNDSEDLHHDEHENETEHSSEQSFASAFPWPFFVVMVGFYLFFFIEKILLPRLFGDSFHVHSMKEEKVTYSLDPSSTREEDVSAGPNTTFDSVGNPSNTEPQIVLEKKFMSVRFLVAFLQIIGLSAHSLFESMALGLSTKFSTVLNVFIATAAHRWATSVAIAFTVASSLAYAPFLVVILLFSAMVPVGVAIGVLLESLSDRVQGVLFSLSAATFLYIGVFENMSEVYVVHEEMRGRKFLFTLTGAAIITTITVILFATGVHH